MIPEHSSLKTGVAAVVITWAIAGVFLAFEERWDVIVAMLVSYAIGGATTTAFGDSPPRVIDGEGEGDDSEEP